MANEILKQLGLIPEEENLSPVMLQNPAVVENPTPAPQNSPGPLDVSGQIQNALAKQQAIGKIVAPQIPAVQENPEEQKLRAEREKAIFDKLSGLDATYKKEMQDADDRKFNSSIFAALGNYLPQAIAGATAMNTKAAVKAPTLPTITPTDNTGRVSSKYKTDYENLLNQYKAIKDGKLTAKDELNRLTTNAYLQAGADRQNSTNANSATSATLRGTGIGMNAEKQAELSDKEKAEVDDLDTTMEQIRNVTKQAESFKDKLGPNAADFEDAKTGRFGKALTELSPIDKAYTEFRSNAKALKGQYQKVISGLTVSDTERKDLEGYIPHERMPYDAFVANANAFEKRVKEIRARKLGNAKKYQGKNVQGYNQPTTAQEKTITKQEYSPSRNQTRITYSDGSTEIKDGK